MAAYESKVVIEELNHFIGYKVKSRPSFFQISTLRHILRYNFRYHINPASTMPYHEISSVSNKLLTG
jgi:hypothetical protein